MKRCMFPYTSVDKPKKSENNYRNYDLIKICKKLLDNFEFSNERYNIVVSYLFVQASYFVFIPAKKIHSLILILAAVWTIAFYFPYHLRHLSHTAKSEFNFIYVVDRPALDTLKFIEGTDLILFHNKLLVNWFILSSLG